MKIFLALIFVAFGFASGQPTTKAWRDINFGESVQVVAEKLNSYKDLEMLIPGGRSVTEFSGTPVELLESPGFVYTYLGGVPFALSFDFFEDQLFRIHFEGQKKTANYFDTDIVGERNTLVKIIRETKGRPDTAIEISFLSMEPQHVLWSHIWNAGNTNVRYNIGIGERESEYYAALWISHLPLLNAYENSSRQENDKEVKEDATDF